VRFCNDIIITPAKSVLNKGVAPRLSHHSHAAPPLPFLKKIVALCILNFTMVTSGRFILLVGVAASVICSENSAISCPDNTGRKFLGHRRHLPLDRSFPRLTSQLRLRGGETNDVEIGPNSNIVPAISEKLGRNLHNQEDHPLQIIKTWIRSHFDEVHQDNEGKPLFTSFDQLNPVVTTKQCFDDLLTPEDHVSRSRNDTYYVDEGRLLRSHMTAHQTTLLREGHRRFLFSGDVYRRDTVDACHYFCFHQMDGVRVFSWKELGVNNHQEAVPKVLEDLKNTLQGMVKAVFGDVQMKWVESFFPFTDPSLEVW
jgi:hypothetical protein